MGRGSRAPTGVCESLRLLLRRSCGLLLPTWVIECVTWWRFVLFGLDMFLRRSRSKSDSQRLILYTKFCCSRLIMWKQRPKKRIYSRCTVPYYLSEARLCGEQWSDMAQMTFKYRAHSWLHPSCLRSHCRRHTSTLLRYTIRWLDTGTDLGRILQPRP